MHTGPLIAVLVLTLGVGLVSARNHLILNGTPSVPVGFYAASSPDNATFVTFCLPPLPAGIRHDPAVCTWSQPQGRPVLKRLVATTHRGFRLCGDTANALDSRLFGPLPPELVRGYWQPVLTFNFRSQASVRVPIVPDPCCSGRAVNNRRSAVFCHRDFNIPKTRH